MGAVSTGRKLDLKVGDWVTVRSAEEILATLDQDACFEKLPFMPQMSQYCGKKLRVRARAHKLCDTAFGTGGRELPDAVFLENLRCDGQAYGGCEMRCTLIWKEAWLKPADADQSPSDTYALERLESLARSRTRRAQQAHASGDPIYVCQATQLPAATRLLPWWKPSQYVEDYKSGNVELSKIVGRLAFLFYAQLVSTGLGFGTPLRWIYNKIQAARGGEPYPVRPGHLQIGGPTPAVNLGLKEGDLVRVKSADEILATVDELLANRGMGFHAEMMPYCGKVFRVEQRVNKLINEKNGQLQVLKNSCLVLEGAECHGRYSRPLNCPRACPPYWREIWLERINSGLETTSPEASNPYITKVASAVGDQA